MRTGDDLQRGIECQGVLDNRASFEPSWYCQQQSGRVLDVGFLQHGRIGSVAFDDGKAVRPTTTHLLSARLDHHKLGWAAVRCCDEPSDASEPDEYRVAS